MRQQEKSTGKKLERERQPIRRFEGNAQLSERFAARNKLLNPLFQRGLTRANWVDLCFETGNIKRNMNAYYHVIFLIYSPPVIKAQGKLPIGKGQQ